MAIVEHHEIPIMELVKLWHEDRVSRGLEPSSVKVNVKPILEQRSTGWFSSELLITALSIKVTQEPS
jgi:hypothetical protein